MKALLLSLFLVFSATPLVAAELTISNAKITSIKAYETSDESVNVWLYINGNGRVGNNPDNSAVTCELWTHDKVVHSTALAALMSGNKVAVTYVDRGDQSHWCNVKNLTLSGN